jgi:hypothetical protein
VACGSIGASSKALEVERTTRFTVLLHLPRMEGHGDVARVKNGPALPGHGAEAVRDAIAGTIIRLPEQLRRSLTWDQGAEMAKHASLADGETLNCEDGVVLADEALRRDIRERHPSVFERIEARRAFVRDQIGIDLKPSILPLSSMPLCLAPFWLASNKLLALA